MMHLNKTAANPAVTEAVNKAVSWATPHVSKGLKWTGNQLARVGRRVYNTARLGWREAKPFFQAASGIRPKMKPVSANTDKQLLDLFLPETAPRNMTSNAMPTAEWERLGRKIQITDPVYAKRNGSYLSEVKKRPTYNNAHSQSLTYPDQLPNKAYKSITLGDQNHTSVPTFLHELNHEVQKGDMSLNSDRFLRRGFKLLENPREGLVSDSPKELNTDTIKGAWKYGNNMMSDEVEASAMALRQLRRAGANRQQLEETKAAFDSALNTYKVARAQQVLGSKQFKNIAQGAGFGSGMAAGGALGFYAAPWAADTAQFFLDRPAWLARQITQSETIRNRH